MIKCIVVDDEPFAQKGLKEYIEEVDFLELIGVCDNAMQAYPFINKGEADLILLDIEMPGLSGIDFLKSLHYMPAVIFTTAYPQYALQGYDLDVIDYLVKPISFQRFLKAVTKAKHFLADKMKDASQTAGENDYFFLKVNQQVERIFYKEVLFVEAMQNYVAVHLNNKKLISYITISNMEKRLPANLFMRIHKSYIAALHKIDSISGNKIMIHTRTLPLSRNTKEKLMQAVDGKLVKR
ncbi:LytR/AlgR family response regulator transcription factor [Parafilimonas sp.]|uniref:LytR/AlgR family response regulator transcription factor n=1 Tax=Parafilimonas sp. TaxID=1969739 RepID=UPI003F7F3152